MDTESNNGTVSDILYPECHLNSPIVKGKIAQLHTIMSLPQPYDMDDDSILVITRQKIKLNKLDKRQRSIRRLKLILTEKVSDLGKYTFIRYPEMSKEMFKLHIPGINSKVTELLLKADRTYSQMTDGLRDLWINVLSKLASKMMEAIMILMKKLIIYQKFTQLINQINGIIHSRHGLPSSMI